MTSGPLNKAPSEPPPAVWFTGVGALPRVFWMMSAVALASGAGEWKNHLANFKKHGMRVSELRWLRQYAIVEHGLAAHCCFSWLGALPCASS